MFKKKHIWSLLKGILIASLVIVSIAFTEKRQTEKVCRDIIVKIKGIEEHEFLTKEDVIDLLDQFTEEELIGGKLIHINSKTLENRLKTNKFVKDAEVLKDLKGNLIVKVTQDQPIARIISKDSSYYINDTGKSLPLSNRYSARVLLVFGQNIDSLIHVQNKNNDEGLLALINHVKGDRFNSAQIASLRVDQQGEVIIYPQVTNTIIEFGECEQIVEKFEKLDIFYQNILPRKGWLSYKKVNLKFKNQIICE